MFDLNKYLNNRAKVVEASLVEFLPFSIAPRLLESMKYSLLVGGKRLRPILSMASWDLFNSKLNGVKEVKEVSIHDHYIPVLPLACCLEMIHTYSLIHDDLPSMDNDDLRRGKPTNHKVYGEGMAILTGDALLTESFNMLCLLTEFYSAENVLKVVEYISKSAGMNGMVGGQVLDIENNGTIQVDAEYLYTTNMCKTGELIKASVVTPAILFGYLEDIEVMESYAKAIGTAFQIIDDVLGSTSTPEQLGKSTNIDTKNNKVTFVQLVGVEAAKYRALQEVEKAKELMIMYQGNPFVIPFIQLADYVAQRVK
jgi:geranylgeranyl diphosphate synthase type II